MTAPLAAETVMSTAPGVVPAEQIQYHYDGCCEPHHFDGCCEDFCEFWHGGNPEWGGFYAGAFIGYGFGETTGLDRNFNITPRGFLGGGTLGWNYQFCNWVVGIETDLAATDIRENIGNFRQSTSFVGTVRARFGHDWCDNLLYVTGGFAYGRTKYDAPAYDSYAKKTNSGWTVGAGLERKLGCNWSAKVEYLYYHLKDFDANYFDGVDTFAVNWKSAAHTVRLGVNYHF